MIEKHLQYLSGWFIFGVIIGSCCNWISPDLNIKFPEIIMFICFKPLITGLLSLGVGFLSLALINLE